MANLMSLLCGNPVERQMVREVNHTNRIGREVWCVYRGIPYPHSGHVGSWGMLQK